MNNMGLLMIQQGRNEEALEPLARAVQLDSTVAVFQNNLGIALEHTGRFVLATQAYKAALVGGRRLHEGEAEPRSRGGSEGRSDGRDGRAGDVGASRSTRDSGVQMGGPIPKN